MKEEKRDRSGVDKISEIFDEKDYHNVTTLVNALRAKSVYEKAHLLAPEAKAISMQSGDGLKAKVDTTIYTMWGGVENGAKNELYEAGHVELVHDIYVQQELREIQEDGT